MDRDPQKAVWNFLSWVMGESHCVLDVTRHHEETHEKEVACTNDVTGLDGT